MASLHNRISRRELKEKLIQDPTPRITISFYQYFLIDHPQEFRNQFYQSLHSLGVLGRIYVASEGINAQISIPADQFSLLRNYLDTIPPLQGVRLNVAVHDDGKSFFVLDIKVRDKIVADGIEDPAFSMQQKGKYASPEQFNKMAQDPNTIIVDMRNHYEYEVGHFTNAIEIPSNTFRDQLPMAATFLSDKKEATILMYCTGGIRCEKASAYLLHITEDIIAQCHQCGVAADSHTNCKNDGCHLLFIQCESCASTMEGCCSVSCRDTIHLPQEDRRKLRKGKDKGQHIFNKAKDRLEALRLPNEKKD